MTLQIGLLLLLTPLLQWIVKPPHCQISRQVPSRFIAPKRQLRGLHLMYSQSRRCCTSCRTLEYRGICRTKVRFRLLLDLQTPILNIMLLVVHLYRVISRTCLRMSMPWTQSQQLLMSLM
eukprot:XP_001708310.1 Hypothetical protein GL50803_94202 [Giardia lamblia ATCC 50803]